MLEKLRREINFPILIILLGAIFVRIYNVGRILEFYFDQGRDALVIWRFLHEGKLFLVGPVTGIEGIFRGPWYYWLITPFYWLGGGDPVWPAVFLSLTTVIAIFLMYLLGKEIHSREAGLLAAIIGSFSYLFVLDSRWLSNPTPMFVISMLLVWTLLRKCWVWVALILGLAMQFGSAAEVFYFPAILLIVLLAKDRPSKKQWLVGGSLFLLLALPQIIFDIRHQGVLLAAIKKFLVEKESFKLSFWEVVQTRFPFYWKTFMIKVFPAMGKNALLFGIITGSVLILKFQELWKKPGLKILLILLISPLAGMLFFQGNYGNIFGYYFTGYFFVFVLLLAILLAELTKHNWGKIVVGYFIFVFLQANLPLFKNYLIHGRAATLLFEQKQAVEWVYEDAGGKEFNVDVYVPPVVPHEYVYLFKWYGLKEYGYEPKEEKLDLLYTLAEQDPPHPERIGAWLERQDKIGKVENKAQFGGITIERRKRY